MKQIIFSILLTIFTIGALTGCGGGDDSDDGGGGNEESSANDSSLQIDARAGGFGAAADDPNNKYTYLDLETGDVMELTDVAAETNSDWDIAFKRTNIKLNGGVSGPGSVKGSVADTQDDFYNSDDSANISVFTNATAENQLDSFNDVTDFSDLTFQTDRNIPAIKGDGSSDGWWLYNPEGHTITANPNQWWLIKSAAANSYAKFHVTDIVQSSRDITLELFIQNDGASNFSATSTLWTANIGAAGGGGSKCFDIDIATEVDCTTAATDWDIKVEVAGQSWNIWTNGGISGNEDGGAFGSFDNTSITTYDSGTTTADGTGIIGLYRKDSAGGTFRDNTWYAYDLQGNRKLWSNYRIYAIDTGTKKYKFQVLSYYNEAGVSGYFTLRYQSISD